MRQTFVKKVMNMWVLQTEEISWVCWVCRSINFRRNFFIFKKYNPMPHSSIYNEWFSCGTQCYTEYVKQYLRTTIQLLVEIQILLFYRFPYKFIQFRVKQKCWHDWRQLLKQLLTVQFVVYCDNVDCLQSVEISLHT